MAEKNYSKRELDHYFKDVRADLGEIKVQTTKTNGRVTKIEKALLIIGTATLVLMATNGSQLIGFIKGII